MKLMRNPFQSIVTKLIAMNLLILVAVVGVVVLNVLGTRQVEHILLSVIEKDVARVVENAELSRNLNNVFATTHLLLNTFIDQEYMLKAEGDKLLTLLQESIATTREPELRQALERFKYTLAALLNQCATVIRISQTTQSLADTLDATIVQLDGAVTELIITRKVAGKDYELYSIEQLSAAIPDYRSTLLQTRFRLSDLKHAFLNPSRDTSTHERSILSLLDELEASFLAVATAGEELIPLEEQLIGITHQYQEQILLLQQALHIFQTQLNSLGSNQSQVLSVIEHIDQEITQATRYIHETVTNNLHSFSNMTIVFSVIVLLVLGGVSLYAVKITRPIRRLSTSVAEVAAGNLEVSIDLSGHDEIGQLARNFASMRDAIREKIADLAQKNAELSQEIRERQRVEAALSESEKKYRGFLQNFHGIAYQVDNFTFKPNFFHGFVKEITGYAAEDFLSGKMTWDQLIHPEDAEQFRQESERLQSIPNYVADNEYRIRRKDGDVRWVNDIGHVIQMSSDNFAVIQGAIYDVTDRKQAEEKIRTLNIDLEQRVKQRTAELESANRELQDFAYVVSHDLKAPLRGISQLAHWIVADYHERLDDQGHEMLSLLVGRVKRLHILIDGILEYSRVGRIVGQDEPIDLETLVRDVIDILALPEHMVIDIATELPVLYGDKVRIAQVFQNLLSNAVKFMDKPNGKITITCLDAGNSWIFRVIDNGPGIDAKHHERIFQIFQTVHDGHAPENTGIGLTLVKKIVNLHGGEIWLESCPGQGSTFAFSLPKKTKESDSQDGKGG